MAIDPRGLRTYLAVCREGSISAAARQLNISQPAVSVTIAQLERASGGILFERSRSGIMLTAAGIALLHRAEALEVLLRNAAEDVTLARDHVEGPLRVGGTPGALVSLVPDAINRLTRAGRTFGVHVLERSDSECQELLRRGEIEIAVVTVGIEAPPDDIQETKIASDPFSLIVGPANHELPDAMLLDAARDLRWVLPDAAGAFRRQLNALFMAANVPLPNVVVRCDSLLTTKAIVRGGDHVTILPNDVAGAEISIGVLRAIRLIDAPITRSIGVRTLAGIPLSRLARAAIEAMRK
ncbi:LysR family transcriptional regulator [Sphingomonas sp. LB3N6]|uniref:LysR family transcriptional regulator n=1 Tax=Sphingomonas fucosidasi TaxID=3096164 RepID=UPI002FC68458